jgi:hypothetical protein
MDINEFKLFNEKIGNYWFSEGSMSFFNSKPHDWDEDTGFFISSEQGPTGSCKRMYSIRRADFETGRVSTVSKFQEFETIYQARKAFKRAVMNPKYCSKD